VNVPSSASQPKSARKQSSVNSTPSSKNRSTDKYSHKEQSHINGTLPRCSARRTPLSSASSTASSVGKLSASVSSGSVQTLNSSSNRICSASRTCTSATKRGLNKNQLSPKTSVSSHLDLLYENVGPAHQRTSVSGSSSETASSVGQLSSSVPNHVSGPTLGLDTGVSCQSLQRLVESTESDFELVGRHESGSVFDAELDGLREQTIEASNGMRADSIDSDDASQKRQSLQFPIGVLQTYEIGPVIGDGNFAVVHQCTHRRSKHKFALKVIDKLKFTSNIVDKSKCAEKEEMIENEVSILKKVKHPNIVGLYDEFNYANELYLVMELVSVSVPSRVF
jgi:hypothetical protein